MAFATVEQVRSQTSFKLLKESPDSEIDRYIRYANSFLRRYTGVNYRNEADPDILTDLERVTVLLVEYIWVIDQEENKEPGFTGVSSENIGSYSYNLARSTGGTGNAELDQLLTYLTPKIGVNFFSVSGPSRAKTPYDVKHAYVTRMNRYEN